MLYAGNYEPNDFKTMSLQSVDDRKPERRLRDNTSLLSNDIEGAQPRLKGYKYINKPSFGMDSHDIEGSKPKQHHLPLNNPGYNLRSTDIDGAQPKANEFRTTRFGSNPLDPVYNLSKVEREPATPPRFVRDAMQIGDIDGASPGTTMKKWNQRAFQDNNDIQGTKPKPAPTLVKPNFMDPRDIITDNIFVSKRTPANPNDPKYTVRDADNNVVVIGDVEGGKPRRLYPGEAFRQRCLSIGDIEGASPTEFGVGNIQRARASPKNPCDIGDIEGSGPDTRKKAFITTRISNPLNPEYQLPGHSEELPDQVEKVVETRQAATSESFSKARATFWGDAQKAPPVPASARSSSCPSHRSVVSSGSLARNARHFFGNGSTPGSPRSEARRLDKAAEAFYGNDTPKPANLMRQLPNPASIHRPNKVSKPVNMLTNSFNQDVRTFYGMAGTPQKMAPVAHDTSLNFGKMEAPASRRSAMSSARYSAPASPPASQRSAAFSGNAPPASQRSETFSGNAQRFYDHGTPAANQNYRFNVDRGSLQEPAQVIDVSSKSYRANEAKFCGASSSGSQASSNLRQAAETFYA